jgi:glycosyltransferase involved in cell wall biosynthesis
MIKDKLKIWLITVGEPLPNFSGTPRLWRTGVLAKMIAKRGHEVTWWTSTVNHFTKTYFTQSSHKYPIEDRLVLFFLHGKLYKKNISINRLINHFEIARIFRNRIKDFEVPNIILCSYPTIELSAEAVKYGMKQNVPVLLDIRDLWPDEMINHFSGFSRYFCKMFLFSMYKSAKFALKGASGIIGTSSSYLSWALRYANRNQGEYDAVFTHGYPEPEIKHSQLIQHESAYLNSLGIDLSKRIVWFVGTFVGSIDLGTVIETARKLINENRIIFVLTGEGERYDEWRKQATGLNNIIFSGWANQSQLRTMASVAWIGLGAYKKGALMSLPNKIFEYIGYGLPVLLSLPGEAKRIIENGGCGRYYEPGNPGSLEGIIRELLNEPDVTNKMSIKARTLFKKKYSAEVVYNQMIDHIEFCAKSFK